MIGLGAKYLQAAGYGRYRITAASLGSLDLLGTLWLKDATRQAIRAAFGADGTAVIAATNNYLNALAAQGQAGRDKATALDGFINEDPMMVCSLGLEPQGVTMPVRWLVADGYSYIKTGVYPNMNTGFEGDAIFLDVSNNYTAYCIVEKAVNNEAFGISWWSGLWHTWYGSNSQKQGGSIRKDIIYHVQQFKGNAKTEGSDGSVWSASNSGTPTIIESEMFFPAARRNNSIPSKGAIGKFKDFLMYDNETEIRSFIPFLSATREGMVDLVNATFHPNQGTGHFTDAYTLQDGVTPWSPSQQP